MKPVNIGIVGYGHFVRRIFLPEFSASPHIRVVGVYNRGEDRRQQAAQDGYWTTGDLNQLLAIPELEAVYIGTSNAAHKAQCIAAARAGKHVLCDKPLALTLAEVDEILSATQAAGVITHVNHGGPYTPAFQDFQRLAREHCGQILHLWFRMSRAFGNWAHGARHWAVANPAESGGWTYHHLCHALDEACLLIESSAVKVYHLAQKSTPESPSEEIVNSLITFANGATAMLSDGTNIGGFGDKGIVGVDGDLRQLGDTLTLVTMGAPQTRGRPGILERKVETFKPDSTGGEKPTPVVARVFAEAVRGGPQRLISFEFVREQYRILDALRLSSHTGQVVDIPRQAGELRHAPKLTI